MEIPSASFASPDMHWVSPHSHLTGMQPHCPVCLHSGFLLQSPGWVMLLQAEGEASGCPLCRMEVIFDVTLNRTCLQAMGGQHTEGVSFAPMRHPTSSGHAPPGRETDFFSTKLVRKDWSGVSFSHPCPVSHGTWMRGGQVGMVQTGVCDGSGAFRNTHTVEWLIVPCGCARSTIE
jgi:hypothetical protein